LRDGKQTSFVDAKGVDECGEWQRFDIKQGHRLVGLYGSINSANNIRGLGFMTWEPLMQ
jgi:hypothetical protein